jgi:hypothetical protein
MIATPASASSRIARELALSRLQFHTVAAGKLHHPKDGFAPPGWGCRGTSQTAYRHKMRWRAPRFTAAAIWIMNCSGTGMVVSCPR